MRRWFYNVIGFGGRALPVPVAGLDDHSNMSYSANMRDARDDRLPLRHRISHLRSCANHMAQKYGLPRSMVLKRIQIKPMYASDDLPSAEAVLRAAALLDQIRREGLHVVSPSSTRRLAVTGLCAIICLLAQQTLHSQECRILSLTPAGTLSWTNSHTNLYAGFQFVERLGNPWQPAPPPYWNILLTNFSGQAQLPAEALSSTQLYLRMVVSSNDLGSGLPVYQVPQRTIVVDGSTNDWSGVAPAIEDPVGDGSALVGSDIRSLFLARDASNIYVRLDLTAGPPSGSLYFCIAFHRNESAGTRLIFIRMNGLHCSVDEFTDDNGNHTWKADGVLAVNQRFLEISVPASALNPPSPSFVSAWSDATGPSIDDTPVVEARYAP